MGRNIEHPEDYLILPIKDLLNLSVRWEHGAYGRSVTHIEMQVAMTSEAGAEIDKVFKERSRAMAPRPSLPTPGPYEEDSLLGPSIRLGSLDPMSTTAIPAPKMHFDALEDIEFPKTIDPTAKRSMMDWIQEKSRRGNSVDRKRTEKREDDARKDRTKQGWRKIAEDEE